jgi:hypothetical protein
MNNKEIYLQFPLSLLAFGHDLDDRIKSIILYSAYHAGSVMMDKKAVDDIENIIETSTNNTGTKYSKDDDDHRKMALGLSTLSCTGHDYTFHMKQHAKVKEFADMMEKEYGTFPTVRVRKDIVLDAMSAKMNPRDFAVFCAVLSIVGDKDCYKTTRARIISCSLGYKSKEMCSKDKLRHLLIIRQDGIRKLMTTKELRTSLDRLENRGLISRCSCGSTCTYYSVRLSYDELKSKVDSIFNDRVVDGLSLSEKRRIKERYDHSLMFNIRDGGAKSGAKQGPTLGQARATVGATII